MSALLDAAAIADRLAGSILRVEDINASRCEGVATALRMLASHARESGTQAKQLDAWKRLAMARLKQTGWSDPGAKAARTELDAAIDAIVALGIDPLTGERIAVTGR